MMKNATGVSRHMAFLIFNDTHFHSAEIMSSTKEYNFFKYVDSPDSVASIYERVMSLCSRVILKDPMGADRRLIDILGYTPLDVFRHDYASLVELEERMAKIEEDHDNEMAEKVRDLEDMQNET